MAIDATRSGAGHLRQWARLLPCCCPAPPSRRAWHALLFDDVFVGFRHSAYNLPVGKGTKGNTSSCTGGYAQHPHCGTARAHTRGRGQCQCVSRARARGRRAQRTRAEAGGLSAGAAAANRQSSRLGPRTASRAVTKPPAGGPPSGNGGELGRRCNNTARGALQGE